MVVNDVSIRRSTLKGQIRTVLIKPITQDPIPDVLKYGRRVPIRLMRMEASRIKTNKVIGFGDCLIVNGYANLASTEKADPVQVPGSIVIPILSQHLHSLGKSPKTW